MTKLFAELGPRYATRPGGYLRILKFGFRIGDNAPMAIVELMDRPEAGADTDEHADKASGAGKGKPAKKAEGAKKAKSAKEAKGTKEKKTAKEKKSARATP